MIKSPFAPCIPTRGTKVPDRPEWIHEIKHDGYRLVVQRGYSPGMAMIGAGVTPLSPRPRCVSGRRRSFLTAKPCSWALTAFPTSKAYTAESTMTRSNFTLSTCWHLMARICGSCPCTFARITSPGFRRDARFRRPRHPDLLRRLSTDMFYLKPPRHISTLPESEIAAGPRHVRSSTLTPVLRRPVEPAPTKQMRWMAPAQG